MPVGPEPQTDATAEPRPFNRGIRVIEFGDTAASGSAE
jgi:hypothetical protein